MKGRGRILDYWGQYIQKDIDFVFLGKVREQSSGKYGGQISVYVTFYLTYSTPI